MSESSGPKAQSNRLPKEPLIVAALIVVVSVTIAVGGIVYKTKDSIQRDKVEFLADANQKQVAPLRRVIQLRLAQDKARLVQFAATRSALGPGRSRVFGEFALVSLLTPGEGGQWGLSWIEKGPLYSQAGSLAGLGENQEIALLKSLPYDRIREGDIHWQRLSDSSGRPVWALAVSVETQVRPNEAGAANPGAASLPEGTDYQSVQVGTGGKAVVVGFFGRNPLLSATEDFIGSTSAAFVIDSRGYAATHSNKAMVGSLLKDDPSVKEVFSARSSAGATRYQSAQGPRIFSAFEQVDRSNLYVVMSTPETMASASGQSFGRTAVTTGLLAAVVGLFMVFAWGARLLPPAGAPVLLAPRLPVSPSSATEIPDEYTREPKRMPPPYGSVLPPIAKDIAAGSAVDSAADRSAFIGRFVRGLERGMKEPLLAALAHVQLVRVKTGDEPSKETMLEISEHVVSVDRDLRRAKEMIDQLAELSSQAGAPTADERSDLSRIVNSIVDQSRADFSADGITLKFETSAVPLVRGREEPLRKAFTEVLKNARRALKGRTAKTVTLRLVDAGDQVKLTIHDNGVGMDRDSKNQAFEPFFHSFDEPDSRGLGLAMVRSIVLSHGGTTEIESTPGRGTTLMMQFPVLASERTAFEKQPIKVETSFEDSTLETSILGTSSGALDLRLDSEFALGGKLALTAEDASGLPPSPRFGAEDDPEEWSFGNSALPKSKPALGAPEFVASSARPDIPNEPTAAVKIRPVRRG